MAVQRAAAQANLAVAEKAELCLGPGGARVAHGIEAKLHQVGAGTLIAACTQLGRGVGRHGHAQFGWFHFVNQSTNLQSVN